MANIGFSGKVVLVTGGSTGLGRAIAVETAAQGAKAVVVNYASSEAEAQETVRLCQAQGAESRVVQGDVGDDEACRAIAAAAEPFGRIDALFNNAGTTKFAQDHAALDAVDSEDFMRLYRVNVVGAFQMIRAARALLEAAAEPSAVVNTSSIAAITGVGSSVPYVASKGALTSMTLSLARALAPKIRVNALCPGFIDTPWFEREMGAEALQGLRTYIERMVPLRVASKAEDIAASAVFLGSPASRHITGETLLVDAGAHLGYAPAAKR